MATTTKFQLIENGNSSTTREQKTDTNKVILMDWEEMSANMTRDEILGDDVHGRYFFNLAVGNIYLNALAAGANSTALRSSGSLITAS